MWIFQKKRFLEHREKRSEFDLGSAFFGISDLGFLPYGVHIKGVIEKKDGLLMENVKMAVKATYSGFQTCV